MLEALLLTAVTQGTAATHAESRTPSKPSLELLEFLGEFGDDEEGLFEGEGKAGERLPAKDARVAPVAPVKPAPVSPPRASPKEPT